MIKYPKGLIRLVAEKDKEGKSKVYTIRITNIEHSRFLFENYDKIGFIMVDLIKLEK